MTHVAIIDYGSGNLRSAAKAFERVDPDAKIIVTGDPDRVAKADRIVLPGVGAFADCRDGLMAIDGMTEALTQAVIDRARPFLGICVGMQLLASTGLEHGRTPGFDWLPGEVRALEPDDPALKVPHMGWNELEFVPNRVIAHGHEVLKGLNDGPSPHAYFVHSYHFCPRDSEQLLATVEYGQTIAAIVGRDNIVGTQFHPEKSQAVGLRLIENFLKWRP
ncbi:MAG: imidazole glycerol phosphate synthase subunit HisH [Alphaproteobacteria bacterium]|nr:imidazole glycerol phosphate synthase subunit HisH [Alphaproteobacteria bacterium]MCZ6764145.1 imidazole glycerol phosphate synthase subunit HisH [Alphaproteobacteria bacterium]